MARTVPFVCFNRTSREEFRGRDAAWGLVLGHRHFSRKKVILIATKDFRQSNMRILSFVSQSYGAIHTGRIGVMSHTNGPNFSFHSGHNRVTSWHSKELRTMLGGGTLAEQGRFLKGFIKEISAVGNEVSLTYTTFTRRSRPREGHSRYWTPRRS